MNKRSWQKACRWVNAKAVKRFLKRCRNRARRRLDFDFSARAFDRKTTGAWDIA